MIPSDASTDRSSSHRNTSHSVLTLHAPCTYVIRRARRADARTFTRLLRSRSLRLSCVAIGAQNALCAPCRAAHGAPALARHRRRPRTARCSLCLCGCASAACSTACDELQSLRPASIAWQRRLGWRVRTMAAAVATGQSAERRGRWWNRLLCRQPQAGALAWPERPELSTLAPAGSLCSRTARLTRKIPETGRYRFIISSEAMCVRLGLHC